MNTLWKGTFTYKINELKIWEDGSGGNGAPCIDGSFWNTFKGHYSYFSENADGQFGIPSGSNSGPIEEFSLFVPHPICYGDTNYSWNHSVVPGPLITVSGGAVTDFSLNSEIGPVGFSFDLTTFQISKTGIEGYSYSVKGWIKIEDPKRNFKGKPGTPTNLRKVVS